MSATLTRRLAAGIGLHNPPKELSTVQRPGYAPRSSSPSLRPNSTMPATEASATIENNQNMQLPQVGFSQSQGCLVITLLRSKPQEVAIEDFLNHLSSNIKLEGVVSKEERRCVDTVEYWKDEYSRLVKDKEALEVEIARLKDSKSHIAAEDVFESQISTGDGSSDTLTRSQKRKADQLHSYDINNSEGELTQGHNIKSHRPRIPWVNVVKHGQILDKHITNPSVSAIILRNSIISTIYNVAQIIERTSADHVNHYPQFELERPFKLAASVFNICLRGLSHLCRDIQGRSLRGLIVYSLIKLFKTVIVHNKELCTEFAATEIADRKRILLPDSPSASNFERCIRPPRLLKARSRFLASILTCPDYNVEHSTHLEVTEGILAVLLRRVGELVSKTVFGEEVATSALHGHISALPATAVNDEVGDLATKLEAELMRWLLRRIPTTSFNGKSELNEKGSLTINHLCELIEGRLKHSKGNESTVLGITRKRLQETLLKGVFGGAETEFRNALKIPDWENEENEAVEGDSYADSDFVNTAWECIGWEMLDTAL